MDIFNQNFIKLLLSETLSTFPEMRPGWQPHTLENVWTNEKISNLGYNSHLRGWVSSDEVSGFQRIISQRGSILLVSN